MEQERECMAEPNVDIEIDLDFLRALLHEAGQMALGQWGRATAMVKADHTPVTEVDRQVEDFLIGRINARYPEHTILSEESGLHPSEEAYTWVLDPVDGTRSFASGLPIWGVSIGVLRRSEPVVGGFYMPVTGEMYWGTRQQAFYNERPLAPVERADPDSILTFLGVPSNFHLHFTISYPRVRSLGSTAAQLAYVATGAAVGSLNRAAHLWDIAGLLPVLAATNIVMVTLAGKPFRPADIMDGKKLPEPVLAAHPSVVEGLLEKIKVKSGKSTGQTVDQ